MKTLLLFLVCCASLGAQSLSFVVHDPTGQTPDAPLPANFQFANTPVGSATNLVIRVTNTTTNPIQLDDIYFTQGTSNFTVTGTFAKFVLAAQGANFEEFTVLFNPITQGTLTANLAVLYEVQTGTCTANCPLTSVSASILEGNATAAQLVTAYSLNGTNNTLDVPDGINFQSVSTSASATATISLVNASALAITTTVSILNAQYVSSAFVTNAPAGSITIPANNAANPIQFTVTFSPGQVGLTTAALIIGSNTYPLVGTGAAVATIDALQISYVDQTGVRTLPQAATPISFGQPTTGSSTVLTFTVTNPTTSFNAISLPGLSVSGSGFAATGVPAMPASIAPGQSIVFQVSFAPAQSGTFTGTLAIGSRQFSLTGLGAKLNLPNVTISFDTQSFSSQQQAHVSVQLDSASTITAIGTLTMQFTPAVSSVADDPAINFLATSGRNLQVTINPGATSATYNGQGSFTFQTGTTAGTITFSLQFPDLPSITKQITISPAAVQIKSSSAGRSSPNLVITLSGYDNTYTAGQMVFNFYDNSGNLITPNGINVDATTNFHSFFFTNNAAGGSFALNATFPVTGDVTKIGSVSVTMNNAAGSSNALKINFQ